MPQMGWSLRFPTNLAAGAMPVVAPAFLARRTAGSAPAPSRLNRRASAASRQTRRTPRSPTKMKERGVLVGYRHPRATTSSGSLGGYDRRAIAADGDTRLDSSRVATGAGGDHVRAAGNHHRQARKPKKYW